MNCATFMRTKNLDYEKVRAAYRKAYGEDLLTGFSYGRVHWDEPNETQGQSAPPQRPAGKDRFGDSRLTPTGCDRRQDGGIIVPRQPGITDTGT